MMVNRLCRLSPGGHYGIKYGGPCMPFRKLARERYAHGFNGYLEVLEAQRTHIHAEIQSAQIVAMEKITLVNFMKALGGGFHAETGTTNLPPTANTTASN
jgi:hypothetical protein